MSRSVLAINAEAHQYHQQGLNELAKDNPFDAALCLNAARLALTSGERTLDSVVQHARITREYGVAFLQGQVDTLLPKIGHELLKESVALTLPIVSGKEVLPIENPAAYNVSDEARSEAFAEHGRTLSWFGQSATPCPVQEEIKEQQPDDSGQEHMVEGLRPQVAKLAKWLGRTGYTLAWTALNDRSNFRPVVNSVANTIKDTVQSIDYKAIKETARSRAEHYLEKLTTGEPKPV